MNLPRKNLFRNRNFKSPLTSDEAKESLLLAGARTEEKQSEIKRLLALSKEELLEEAQQLQREIDELNNMKLSLQEPEVIKKPPTNTGLTLAKKQSVPHVPHLPLYKSIQ